MLNEKANNPMNKFNQYLKHRGHLERIYLSKSLINNKCPKIPSFIKKGLINKGIENEKKFRIKNDNNVMYKKLIYVVNSKSKYNHLLNIPSKCPAFERKDKIQIKRFKNIIKENNLFYKILKRSRSTYDNIKIEEDYMNSRYYKNNICKNNSMSNPNINFVNYRQFSINLKNILKDKIFNRTINYSDCKKNKSINQKYRIISSGIGSKRQSSIGY